MADQFGAPQHEEEGGEDQEQNDDTGSVSSVSSGASIILVAGYHTERFCRRCGQRVQQSLYQENLYHDLCLDCLDEEEAHELEMAAREDRAQSNWSPTCENCSELKENCEMCEECREAEELLNDNNNNNDNND